MRTGTGGDGTSHGAGDPWAGAGRSRNEPLVLGILSAVALVASGIGPFDRLTWFLEVLPVLIAYALLLSTWRRFPLSPLLLRLLFVHALILILGGHYTYAQVPLGRWVQEAFDLGRNHYDRLGHFAQGFVPAILLREIYIRRSPIRRGWWLFLFVTASCLAFSAAFELEEWLAATAFGSDADAYLATQGDPWDTQWDMFLCLVGSITSQALLSRVHDRQLAAAGPLPE